jgi:ABC-type nitrate/sulfonate/bicarbonate transport system substrate-binding protein
MVVQGFKVLAKTADVAESPFNGVAVGTERLRSRPERMRKGLKALLEAYRRIKLDRAGSVEYIRQSFKVSDKIAENSYNEIREVMLDDMIMPEEQLKKAIDVLTRAAKARRASTSTDIADYSILRSLR